VKVLLVLGQIAAVAKDFRDAVEISEGHRVYAVVMKTSE
jgi:hypothetical protein